MCAGLPGGVVMARVPKDPNTFTDFVASLIRKMQPRFEVEVLGTRELLVNGRRLDLENLYRMVSHEPVRGKQIVDHYLDQLFSGEAMQLLAMTLEFARPRIMPRIQPDSIFEHLNREQVAHVSYVNGTSIVFVTDLPNMTVSITTEQAIRWGLSIDDLDEIARGNLGHYATDLDVQFIESKEGGRAAILGNHDGYDAARILLGDLHDRLSDQLGCSFYVATPARDMFVALSTDPDPFVARLHNRVEQDYRRLPYPITSDFFLVTRDGVAGTRNMAEVDPF